MGFYECLCDRLANTWLRLQLAYARWRMRRSDRRLRRHEIDPDSIPEIQELKRRYAERDGQFEARDNEA